VFGTEFKSADGSRVMILTLRREKKKEQTTDTTDGTD